MAMKRAMKSAKETKPKKKTKTTKPMKKTKTPMKKTITTKPMQKTTPSEDDQKFEKVWKSTYVEYVNGLPFSWKMVELTWNKATGRVVETWRWAAV